MSQTVRFEKQDSIAIVTIDRPEALNALNGDVIAELEQVVTALENDRDVRCMILTGEGRSFVAGADIGEQYPLDLDGGRRWGQRGSALFRRIEKLEFPTIAAVNGFALGGGCELALSCDIILASEKAKFGQPEVGLGITPGFSGTQRLPRRVGQGADLLRKDDQGRRGRKDRPCQRRLRPRGPHGRRAGDGQVLHQERPHRREVCQGLHRPGHADGHRRRHRR